MARRHVHPHRPPAPTALRSIEAALAVVERAASPPHAETICLLLEAGHLPLSCIVVEGGGEPDDVVAVADLIAELASSLPVAHVVVASCRPDAPASGDDIARFDLLDATLAEVGVELLEWLVCHSTSKVAIGPLAGAGSRWPS